jgi:hypothetical protein
VAVILLLYSARVFTPANAHVVRPLYFDFTQPQAEATVNLLGAEPYTHYIHDLHELRAKVRPWTCCAAFLSPAPVPALDHGIELETLSCSPNLDLSHS